MNHYLQNLKSILNRSILALLFFSVCQNLSFAQVQNGSFVFGGQSRNYLVFLPQNYQPNMPVVFNLHGYTDYAQWQMDYTLMNDVADTAGFIVVYPDAISPGFNTGLVYGNWPALPTNVDDVGFISALIDTIYAHYNVNKNRVYCCGYSNGGLMTFKLACQLGHRFAAFASVAGVMLDPIAANYSFVGSVPMLMCHGTDDLNVHYNGGPYPMMWSAEETLNFWTQNNNCVLNPDTIAIPDTCLSDSSHVQKISYTDCSDSVQVVFYKVINGGHSWPSANLNITWGTEGNKNRDINANIEIWNFCKNFTNPYTNIAYGRSIDVNPKYFQPQGDSLFVIAEVSNTANHQVEVFAMIQGENYSYQDSIQLYDDGLHGDGDPSDNIWGGVKWYSGLAEDMYLTSLSTWDITDGTVHRFAFPTRFTTTGPVVFEDFDITSSDTIPNHGNNLKFQFTLKNLGLIDTARNVTSQLLNLDTCAYPVGDIFPDYGNIAPGQAVTGSKKQYIQFNLNSPDSVFAKFRLDIYSNENLFWSDTFSIFIHKDPTGLDTKDKMLPKEFSLKQNYPNPFNPTTNIQFSIPKAEFVILRIYNLLGQEVTTLVSENLNPSHYSYSWDAGSMASGVYFYELKTRSFSDIRKMILLR